MGSFLDNARNLFEAAESAAAAGAAPSGLTILIGPEGAIRMLSDSDWPLDSLLRHHGAQMAYRVQDRDGKTCLEGRAAGSRRCVLEAESRRQPLTRRLPAWQELSLGSSPRAPQPLPGLLGPAAA